MRYKPTWLDACTFRVCFCFGTKQKLIQKTSTNYWIDGWTIIYLLSIQFDLFCFVFCFSNANDIKKNNIFELFDVFLRFSLSVFGFFLGTALDFYLSAMRPVSFNENLFFEWCDFSLHFSDTQMYCRQKDFFVDYLCRYISFEHFSRCWVGIWFGVVFNACHFTLNNDYLLIHFKNLEMFISILCNLNVRGSINFDETTTCKVTFLQLTLNCFGFTEFISTEFCSSWIISLMFKI